MRIDTKDGVFLGIGTYADKETWKKAGFERFSRKYGAWITRDPEIAKRAKGAHWTDRALDFLDDIEEVQAVSRELSYAADTAFEPPCPKGINPTTGKPFAYLNFQKAGVQYSLLRRDTLIADQPGLGKTVQAVGVSNADSKCSKVLVICPASLKENWRREFVKWGTKGLSVGIAETQYKEKVQDGFYKNGKPKFRTVTHARRWPNTDVVIINYDILDRFLTEIDEVFWDLLICDECHALKTDTARRTVFVFGGSLGKGREKEWFNAIDARRRVFLSGTPMMNRPVELWNFVRAFDPAGLGKSWTEFTDRYCAAHTGFHGLDVSGCSNPEELGAKLRERFMIRRLKKEVLPDLPPKIRGVITLDTPEIREIVAREDELAIALRLYEKIAAGDAYGGDEVVESMARFGVDAIPDENADWTRKIDLEYSAAVLGLEPPAVAILFEELAAVRRELGIAKLAGALPWIKNTLDGGEKLLVFAYHATVVEALFEGLSSYHPALVYGKTPVLKRQGQVDRFQEDDECRVFIGNIDAAGVGLTLTRASNVCFAELDWTPTKLEQCEDRCCRIGSTFESIFSSFLVANGSLDSRIAQSAHMKEGNINRVLDT